MAFLYVKAYHGPCTTFNCQSHKPGYLTGLQSRLRKLGFRVDLVPVDFVNYCMLEMCGFQIFRCNIRQLRFNTSYDRDVVCQRAIKAVMESSIKFRRARAILWLLTLLDRELFNRSENAPLDYWISKIKIKEDRLFTLGYRMDLVPVDILNYCMLEMCSRQIFRCNIKNFKFNTSYERDAVCQKAVETVMQASVKFRRARAYLWFWTLIDHQLFTRSSFGPKDFWLDKVKIEPPNFDIDGLDDVDDSVDRKEPLEV